MIKFASRRAPSLTVVCKVCNLQGSTFLKKCKNDPGGDDCILGPRGVDPSLQVKRFSKDQSDNMCDYFE